MNSTEIALVVRMVDCSSGFYNRRLRNVTREELGWEEDDKTRFVGPEEVLSEVLPNVIVSIDARTGEILSRAAGITVHMGGSMPEKDDKE